MSDNTILWILQAAGAIFLGTAFWMAIVKAFQLVRACFKLVANWAARGENMVRAKELELQILQMKQQTQNETPR